MRNNYENENGTNILVIGNGFDIALGLPTHYTDFINFLRINDPIEIVSRVKAGNIPEKDYEKFFRVDQDSIDLDEIKKIVELRQDNSWVEYYNGCKADIKGWIDLEREMLPVLEFFKWLFEQQITMCGDGKGYKARIILQAEDKYRLAKILPKFVSTGVINGSMKMFYVDVNPKYCNVQYGIFKEKIIEKLIEDFNDFIEMFRLYLREMVCNAERQHHSVIENLKADKIISFNYLQSELYYPSLKDAEVIHVHGDITKQTNMVLGVNEIPDDMKKDFLYFTKSFQRIKIKANPKYRDFWNDSFNVTFFGHSLDITDIDIIKPLYEKAKHVKIYYYSEKDYAEKIMNLIKLTDIQRIEDDNYSGRLELIYSGT